MWDTESTLRRVDRCIEQGQWAALRALVSDLLWDYHRSLEFPPPNVVLTVAGAVESDSHAVTLAPSARRRTGNPWGLLGTDPAPKRERG